MEKFVKILDPDSCLSLFDGHVFSILDQLAKSTAIK